MKYVSLVSLLFWIVACAQPESKKNVRIIKEREIPVSILNSYSKIISLEPQDITDSQFEIRIWDKFVSDSFPTFLKRLYLKNSKLKAELYFFERSTSKDITYEKLEIDDLSLSLLDTIRSSYNIENITVDTTPVRKLYEQGMILFSAPFQFIEQTSEKNYTGIFLRSPQAFEDVSKDYYNLVRIYKFLMTQIFYKNENVKRWVESKIY